MSFAGNLKTVSFGDALQLISTGKRTGALHLKRPNRGKTIFFRDGCVIAATSSPPVEEERLGQLLLHRGEITPDDLTRALKRQRASGKRLGQALVDLGFITGSDLSSILRLQVEEIVYSIFGWPEGDFHFVEEEKPDSADIPIQLNTLNIMMEGARRYDEYTQIAEALPAEDTVLRLSAIPHLPDGEISLTDGDLEVMAIIDGERTVGEVVCATSQGEYASSKSLHKLITAELVQACPQITGANAQRKEQEEVFALVFKIYSRCLDTVRQTLVEHLGDAGERLFVRVPEGCRADPWDLISTLIDTPQVGGMETFCERARKIPAPVRVHRVLTTAGEALDEAMRLMADRIGPRLTNDVVQGLQKELTLLLVQKRDLADKYEVKREFLQALKGNRQ